MRGPATCAAALALALAACAPSIPSFAGASTTPEGRGDLLVGASYRAAVTGLQRSTAPTEPAHILETFAVREGAAPAVAARYGVGRRLDVGVSVSGTAATLDLRYAAPFDDAGTYHLMVGVRGLGAWTTGDGVSGALGGLDIPAVFSVSISGAYELWLGAHVAGIAGAGDLNGARTDAAGARVGGILGLSLGFSSFAVMVELQADYETWLGHVAPSMRVSQDGFVLTPALALRLRI